MVVCLKSLTLYFSAVGFLSQQSSNRDMKLHCLNIFLQNLFSNNAFIILTKSLHDQYFVFKTHLKPLCKCVDSRKHKDSCYIGLSQQKPAHFFKKQLFHQLHCNDDSSDWHVHVRYLTTDRHAYIQFIINPFFLFHIIWKN